MTSASLAASRSIWLGMVSSAITGCGDSRALEYQTSKPDVGEVVGRHVPIESQSAIPESTEATRDSAKSCSLALNEDGTSSATNVPGLDAERVRLVHASGHWELATNGGLVSPWKEDRDIWGVRFESEPSLLRADLLTDSRLVFVRDEPDGPHLTFRRGE